MSGCRHGKLVEWPVKKWDVNDHPNNAFWRQLDYDVQAILYADHGEDYDRICDAAPTTTWKANYEYLRDELNKLITATIPCQASV
jgi:hypothetical protein